MQAVVLEQPGEFTLIDLPEPPPPGEGEALIRIHRIGVCGTDIHAFRGDQPFFSYPRILGHELGVEVLALGDATGDLAVGQPAALEPYFNCGACPACLRDRPNCCLKIKVFGVHTDGGMRELALVPARKLHPGASLSYEQLALVEPLAIGAHAVARGQLVAGERVLVVGVGPIGLSVVTFALLAGAEVLVTDVSEQRLAFCKAQWPAVSTFHGGADPATALGGLVDDDLPIAVFDATGNRESMMAAFQYVAHGGRLVFVGLFTGAVTFDDPNFHRREMTLHASRNATAADFRRIIAAMEAGALDIEPWITHRALLDTMIGDFPRWFEHGSGLLKALVTV